MRLSALALLAAAAAMSLAAPSTSRAATPKKASPPKVAILDVKTVGTFDPKTVQGLSAVVASEAQRFPVKAVAGTDLATLIGFEKSRVLMGCSDSGCLAEIGGALGVEYLLATEVSEVGGVWLITATTLDVVKAQALQRVIKKTPRAAELVELAGLAASEALEAIAPATTPRHPDLSLTQPAPGRSAQRTAGYALDGVGAALLVGGAVCGVLTMTRYDAARSATTPADFESARSQGKATGLAADVLYGVGAAALVAGLVLTFTAPSEPASPSASVAVSPALTSAGAGLVVSGGF